MGNKTIVISAVIILGISLIGLGIYFGQKNNLFSFLPQPTTSPSPISSPVPTTGIIEGSLSFPSEVIPEEMITCAENIEAKEEFCTDKRIEELKYTYRVGYKLEVPEGKYLVYSKLPPDEYQAYYNEFVTCGLSVECESHEPIVVEVKAGLTTTGVDPQDWYNRPAPAE